MSFCQYNDEIDQFANGSSVLLILLLSFVCLMVNKACLCMDFYFIHNSQLWATIHRQRVYPATKWRNFIRKKENNNKKK